MSPALASTGRAGASSEVGNHGDIIVALKVKRVAFIMVDLVQLHWYSQTRPRHGYIC